MLEGGRLQYHAEKIGDEKNIKAWIEVISQIGFQETINILIDVSESTDAKNKGACAMALAIKAGYVPRSKRGLYRPNKDRL